MSPAPDLEYERKPCPRCGARNSDEAGDVCQPTQDIGGDYTCPADEKTDEEGFFMFPTQAYLDRLDAWCNEQMTEEGAK